MLHTHDSCLPVPGRAPGSTRQALRTTETRHLDRPGQLGEFEQESSTESEQRSNKDSHSAQCRRCVWVEGGGGGAHQEWSPILNLSVSCCGWLASRGTLTRACMPAILQRRDMITKLQFALHLIRDSTFIPNYASNHFHRASPGAPEPLLHVTCEGACTVHPVANLPPNTPMHTQLFVHSSTCHRPAWIKLRPG